MENFVLRALLVAVCLIEVTTLQDINNSSIRQPISVTCSQPEYEVPVNGSVTVCLQTTGFRRSKKVSASVKVIHGDQDEPIATLYSNWTFELTSQEPLLRPCVEVVGRSINELVIVMIEMPRRVSNCTVRVVDLIPATTMGSVDTTVGGLTSGTPQPQTLPIGAIVGAIIGALIGLVGLTVAIVTLLVVFCRCRDRENKSDVPPKPVVYKKQERESSGSEVSVRLEATPIRNADSVSTPRYTENPNGHIGNSSIADESTPGSPIYSNISNDEQPEDYEVPLPLSRGSIDQTTPLANGSASQIALPYEVPISSCRNSHKSDDDEESHLYHTLEPSVHLSV